MNTNRRQFLKRTALAGAGWCLAAPYIARSKDSANEKMNVGIIGTANRAGVDMSEVAKEQQSVNIVALCDIDDNYLAAARQKHPGAKTYTDFRELLSRKDLDAVVIGTPDHTHAVITMMALQTGRHVYCEKPLTHTVSEARIIAEAAKKHKSVTQMGTQIHAGKNYRRVVELLQSGAIGMVKEVHVWVDVVNTAEGRPKETPPVPPHLHYDMWLGPAPYRPYSPEYIPKSWRHWWDFGGGTLEDFGCHHIDLSYWALNLRYPLSVETEGPPPDKEVTCPWMIARYEYPARGSQPPLKLIWYHGGKRPPFPECAKENWESAGLFFVGEKGNLIASYGKHQLLPEADFKGFIPPTPTIPDSIGHHKEWIEACKTGGPTTCNFDYGGALTEAVLLGNVAYRTGKKLIWDPVKLKATNCPEADQFIQHHYRDGWKL